MRPADTTLEAQRFQWNVYAGFGPQRRFELMNDMCRGLVHSDPEDSVERSLEEFVLDVAGKLDRFGIPYMIVGSVAAGIWGAPRYTQDLDLVVRASGDQARSLAQSFESSFYVGHLETAAARLDMANVIDPTTGWKADFIWAQDTDWDEQRLARRTTVMIGGKPVSVSSAEDLVIAKLLWSELGESEMQLRDVANILGVSEIDRNYLNHWAEEMDVADLLRQVEAS